MTVAKALIALGVPSRGAIAIMGFNSPEWFVADLAAAYVDAAAAGVYATNGADAATHIAQDCGASVIVAEDEGQIAKFDKEKLTQVKVSIERLSIS